jgi:rhamnose utilization protein RhaD (predicted bifunctional aldolase and dehydrogenase)
MVDAVRGALLSSRSPNPSVETLLHAFLPHAFVDHTHANAMLVVTDQPDPEAARARGVRRRRAGAAVDHARLPAGEGRRRGVRQQRPNVPRHRAVPSTGLFTFGATARESYERTIELVDRAERYLRAAARRPAAMLLGDPAAVARWPSGRRCCSRRCRCARRARGAGDTSVGAMSGSASSPRLAPPTTSRRSRAHATARALCASSNPMTPDHVIRTKGQYLVAVAGSAALDGDQCRREVPNYVAGYTSLLRSLHARRFELRTHAAADCRSSS